MRPGTAPKQRARSARLVGNQLRRIPIVDAIRQPIGVISINDLAVESIAPDTRMQHGPAKIAHTLAAISRPHAAPHAP